MDDRQTELQEGKGLEDSRINQEFLDFLNKWSSPVLLTLAVAALVWAGMQYLHRKEIARIDQAFGELAAATQGGNPSPQSLKALAGVYEGVRSVPELALLTTSDLYLSAFVVGIEPGAQMSPMTGLPGNESDLLSDTERKGYLEQAGRLAKQVLDLSDQVKGKELLAMQAMCRLAAVAEGKRDFASAKAMYERLATKATDSMFPSIAVFAKNRIENIGSIENLTALPLHAELIALPGQDVPATLTQEQIQELLNSIPSAESDLTDVSADVPSDELPDADLDAVPTTDPVVDPATQPESP